nr:hypothetical protein [Aquibium microcysteis]
MEELVEGRAPVARLLEMLRRGADDHRAARPLQDLAQPPGLGSLQRVEDEVEIVEQEKRPQADFRAGREERPGRFLGIAPGRSLHLAVEPVGLRVAAGGLQPFRQRIAAIAPQGVRGDDVVLLLAKAQRHEGSGQCGIRADADGDAAQERGLTHAARADQHEMFARPAAELRAQLVEDRLQQGPPRDEIVHERLVVETILIVESDSGQ